MNYETKEMERKEVEIWISPFWMSRSAFGFGIRSKRREIFCLEMFEWSLQKDSFCF